MNKQIDLTGKMVTCGTAVKEEGELFITPDESGFTEMDLTDALCAAGWKEYRYFAVDMLADIGGMVVAEFSFYTENDHEKPNHVLSYNMIPTREVTVMVDFDELLSKRQYQKNLPGMLKAGNHGLPTDIAKVDRVTLRFRPGFNRDFKSLRIYRATLSDEAPEISVKGEPMVDEFGQWIAKDWDTKTHSEEELVASLRAEYERAKTDNSYPDGWSRFGGYRKAVFDKTGFFHVVKTKERWWLVDPDGYGFFSNGVCYGSRMGVYGLVDQMESLFSWLPDKDDPTYREAWTNAGEIAEYVKREGKESGVNRMLFNFPRANMIRAFGPRGWWDAWETINVARLKRWGFNTIGVGVNNYFDEHVMEYLNKAKMPFVWTLKEFPQTEEKIFRDFPDVFSPEYREKSEIFAREQLAPFAGNPYMIGYFINNEPEWGFVRVNLGERVLAHPKMLNSKKVFVSDLKKEYDSVDALNDAWNCNFTSFDDLYEPMEGADCFSEKAKADCLAFHDRLVEEYETVVLNELKKVDPDHLDLGMRYNRYNDNVMAAAKYHEVFSLNCYSKAPATSLDQCLQAADRPMIIGEWHIGGGDKGNLSHGLLASPNQEERGRAMEYYLQRAMAHPNCVGAHYFEMNDQPLLGRFDGECMQHGLIDVCNREFPEVVEHLMHTNLNMYDYVSGALSPTDVEGELEEKR